MPSLFQDNFDYLDLRRDFVHGILTSDILQKSIYLYFAEDGYAARVQDTRCYDSIRLASEFLSSLLTESQRSGHSKDILSRWTFPLVPDGNHPGGHIYEHTRGNRYFPKDGSVVLARCERSSSFFAVVLIPSRFRTANVGTNTLIGASVKIAEDVTISASVIGPNCTIDSGTTIKNAYIFENTTIGSNCTIQHSIVGAGVVVKDGSVIPKGCLIGDSVVIGPDATLREFERLSMKQLKDGDTIIDNEDNPDEDGDSDIEEVEARELYYCYSTSDNAC